MLGLFIYGLGIVFGFNGGLYYFVSFGNFY